MARIAFFTETLPPSSDLISGFAYDLMRSLAEQQHEVYVLSTWRPEEVPPSHSRISILRPFRTWNWLEMSQIIPVLFSIRPDILHVIQPRAEALSGLTNAMSLLPQLSPFIGGAKLVSSFYDLGPNRLRGDDSEETVLNLNAKLIMGSDAVTLSNEEQKRRFCSWIEGDGHQPITRILPVPTSIDHVPRGGTIENGALKDDDQKPTWKISDSLRGFLEKSGPLVVIPGHISDHTDPDQLFHSLVDSLLRVPNSRALFCGNWGGILPVQRRALMRQIEERGLGSRFLISGDLPTRIERACFSAADIVFLASLPLHSLRMTQIFRNVLRSQSPFMATPEQLLADGLPWQDCEYVFETSNDTSAWVGQLCEALTSWERLRVMKNQISEFARVEAIDQPANAISRLYAELLVD
jgi:hypothetical protein